MTSVLNLYIAGRFARIVGAAFLGVLALVVTVDLVELMRENDDGAAPFSALIVMALLRAPAFAITAAPFTILLAAMATFAMLARSSEITVARAAGLSSWSIITPAIVVALMAGGLTFGALNPLAAALADRGDRLTEEAFGRSSSRLTVAGEGIWLRQGDRSGQTVIRARRASSSLDRLWDVSVFRFGEGDRLVRRIDARTAKLEPGHWRLNAAQGWDIAALAGAQSAAAAGNAVSTAAEALDETRIDTDLTIDRIAESFQQPETIGFWDLPAFIDDLERSGFSSARHRMHWMRLLTLPLVFAAMVIVAAAFSMRSSRFGGLGLMALGCLVAGFGYFVLSDVATALGASGAVPVALAAWGPPISALLFAFGLLLQFEDG